MSLRSAAAARQRHDPDPAPRVPELSDTSTVPPSGATAPRGDSYEAHCRRLLALSLPPAALAICSLVTLYAAAVVARGDPPAGLLHAYAIQFIGPAIAALLVRGRLRDRALLLVLLADAMFTGALVAQILLPLKNVSGVALVLSLKMMSSALFFPWSSRCQCFSSVMSLGAYLAVLILSPRAFAPAGMLHQVLGPVVAAALSAFGAIRADRSRRAQWEAEEALRESEEALRTEAQVSGAMARVGRELISLTDAAAILDRLCRLTTDLVGCDSSHTLLWRPEAQSYSAIAGFGDPAEHWETLRLVEIPGAQIPRLTARLEREETIQVPILLEGESGEPSGSNRPENEIRALAARLGVTHVMCFALRRDRQVIGFQTACYRGDRGPFRADQMRIARGIGHLASLALEHAQLVEALEHASRLKSEFVATMSHELRTPLNVINGYNDLLLDGAFGPLTEEQSNAIARVNQSAQQLLEQIEATLDLSRLEAGRVELALDDVDVGGLVAEIQAEIHPLLEGKGDVTLRSAIDPQLPLLHTDPAKLKVVLKNLVSNAVKFTDAGEIVVSARSDGTAIAIDVADTGIGIPAEMRDIIFEPFRQADGSSTRRHGGVGLGLHIVGRLTELLHGSVEVESTVGAGSRFRLRIPGRAAAEPGDDDVRRVAGAQSA